MTIKPVLCKYNYLYFKNSSDSQLIDKKYKKAYNIFAMK